MPLVEYPPVIVADPYTKEVGDELFGREVTVVNPATGAPIQGLVEARSGVPLANPVTVSAKGYTPWMAVEDGPPLVNVVSGDFVTPVWSPSGAAQYMGDAQVAIEAARAAAQAAEQSARDAAAGAGAPADDAVATLLGTSTSQTRAQAVALIEQIAPDATEPVEWGSIPQQPGAQVLTAGDGLILDGPALSVDRDALDASYVSGVIVTDTDAPADIATKVASAATFGAPVHWTQGVHASTGSIPGFHTVQHTGPGVVQRGADTFHLNPRGNDVNRLYVSPTGDDANDGLTADQPLATIQAAFDAVARFGPTLTGSWRVILAAGTHTAPARLVGLTSEQYLVVEGPPAAYGAPTAIIDPGPAAEYGLWFGHGMRAYIHDVRVQNVTGSSVASGIVLDFGVYGWLDNVHTDNCTWAGVNANIGCRLVVQGGTYVAQSYGIRVYGASVATIGYQGQRTTVDAVTGVIFQANSSGHTDNTDFTGCDTGLIAESRSHTSNYGNTYTNCGVGWQTSGFGSIATDAATRAALTGVTIPSRHRAGFATGDEDATHRHAIQYRDDLGTTGRFAFGYPDWTAPWVKYQFSSGATGGNLSSYAPCTMLIESDANTILGLTSKDANTSEVWFGNSTTPNAFTLRYATSVAAAEMRFGSTTAYRFRPTDVFPLTDNALDMGRSTFRWRNVYAGTGTIQTSDEREKQDIAPLDDPVLDAWADVELAGFRFKDAVAEKGDAARTHIGVIAQRIVAAFEAHGLDAFDYGLVTYDEWDDETDADGEVVAPAGNRYGVRADECLFLEAALVRRRLAAIGA